MAIGGVGVDGSPGLTGPLLTSTPGLPYMFAPPAVDDGAIEEWTIVWLTLQAVEMIIRGWLLPIG